MSLLIQTSVLIMVIALITYSRLELFIPRHALEKEIVNYMANGEREWMNRAADAYYNDMKPEKKEGDASKPPPNNAPKGTSYISIKPLFEEEPQRRDVTKILLRNLMLTLYGHQPFVQEEMKKGGFPDAASMFTDLIDSIIRIGQSMPPEDRPKTQEQFIQMDLGPLQALFVNVINGCSTCPATSEGIDEDSGEVEVIPRNYCSLFSFANMQGYRKLSVYLAPQETLMAIYGNPQVVSEIMQSRIEAYKRYKDNPSPDTRNALERFKSAPAAVDVDFLEFAVTGTNPERKRKGR
jgi:hypothetical protein